MAALGKLVQEHHRSKELLMLHKQGVKFELYRKQSPGEGQKCDRVASARVAQQFR